MGLDGIRRADRQSARSRLKVGPLAKTRSRRASEGLQNVESLAEPEVEIYYGQERLQIR